MVKKFSFLDYLYEIWTVAVKLRVDVEIAFLMFRADVALGSAVFFNTGDALPTFEFLEAKESWDALLLPEQIEANQEWTEFITECYSQVCELYPDGEKLQALADAWRTPCDDED